MKIVVIGGSGLIGTRLVRRLDAQGHTAVAASRTSGVDVLSGAGVDDALSGADVVVDVTNSPSFEDTAVLEFFRTATRTVLDAAAAGGVTHLVALSVVGADRSPDSGYLRAKHAQEQLIEASAVPYTILRATQFFEFLGAIADASTAGDVVALSPALMQPVAADDVAGALADTALDSPSFGIVDLAGPEKLRLDDLVRHLLDARADPRRVETDAAAGYFGAQVDDRSLVPLGDARIGATRFEDWLAQP